MAVKSEQTAVCVKTQDLMELQRHCSSAKKESTFRSVLFLIALIALAAQPARHCKNSTPVHTQEYPSIEQVKHFINHISLSPSGQLAACSHNDGLIRLWQLQPSPDVKQILRLPGSLPEPRCMAFSGDSRYLLVCEDARCTVAEISTGLPSRIWNEQFCRRAGICAAWMPDGRYVLIENDFVLGCKSRPRSGIYRSRRFRRTQRLSMLQFRMTEPGHWRLTLAAL